MMVAPPYSYTLVHPYNTLSIFIMPIIVVSENVDIEIIRLGYSEFFLPTFFLSLPFSKRNIQKYVCNYRITWKPR